MLSMIELRKGGAAQVSQAKETDWGPVRHVNLTYILENVSILYMMVVITSWDKQMCHSQDWRNQRLTDAPNIPNEHQ